MTKHTDTSRSGDLVERLRDPMPPHHGKCLKAADRIEALEAEVERLREALAKSEALQDLAYYNGAKQYAVISAQSEDAARDWISGGCGNRQRDAIAALGDAE